MRGYNLIISLKRRTRKMRSSLFYKKTDDVETKCTETARFLDTLILRS